MKLRQKAFTVGQLLAKVDDGSLDLQPSFQRGEVWTEIKKKRLVDTVLRNWYIPPIHLVQIKEGKLEVLDGQQRLRALREFHGGQVRVDGDVNPPDPKIRKLGKKLFSDLPAAAKNRFLRFPIKAIILHKYAPEEPGELFFRLNQLSGLTPAEQRNAFYGTAKFQVREILAGSSESLFNLETLGFSNTRLGYDDVIARVCYALEVGTHHKKITAKAVEEKYRSKSGFSKEATQRTNTAVNVFAEATQHFGSEVTFNKATLFSWLCFVAEVGKNSPQTINAQLLGRFVRQFELLRTTAKGSESADSLLLVFNDRASSRVADVTSVLARDFVLWSFWVQFCRENGVPLQLSQSQTKALKEIAPSIKPPPKEPEFEMESALMDAFSKHKWGTSL